MKRTLNQRLGFTPIKKEPSFIYCGSKNYLGSLPYRPVWQMDNTDRMIAALVKTPKKLSWWQRILS